MDTNTPRYDTWHSDPTLEPRMEEAHRPYWRHYIGITPETDLSTRDVLDFGCNRGGFLRLLYALKPFRRAMGVDIAQQSLRDARELAPGLPIRFEDAGRLAEFPASFDIAFSYEVIYLLPDLAQHAALMHAALRPGGVYYAVTGCHTANPIWPHFRAAIAATSNAPVQDRSPEDYAATFQDAGFQVSVRRFGYDGFVPFAKDSKYYPALMDALEYPDRTKLLFRLVRN